MCSAGEIFGGLAVASGSNDSQSLLQALSERSATDVLNSVRGPWAAVYWHAHSRTLWFGRDVLGTPSPSCVTVSPAHRFSLVRHFVSRPQQHH